MFANQRSNRLLSLILLIGLVGVGVAAGLCAAAKPFYLALLLVAAFGIIYFFAKFEQAVIGLLIIRSSLDAFSAQQIPAAYSLAVDALTLLYVAVKLLTGQPVKVDKFWWLFAAWVIFQGLWVILLPIGGLGLNGSYLADAIREWVRLFTWVILYLLVMQLADKIPPQKYISLLLLCLVLPVTVALMQSFVPSLLPAVFSPMDTSDFDAGKGVARLQGTIGHPNSFAVYLLLFIGLTCWKLGNYSPRWLWGILLALLAFVFVGAKMLMSLGMLATFVLVLTVPRLNLLNLVGAIILFSLIIGLFASTPFGQERLASIAQTPLVNPNIDVSRAILLAKGDNNSFNWRLGQWYTLLNAWKQHPMLGYGLGLSIPVASNHYLPHDDYIRALIEGGIVGLVTFVGFICAQALHLINIMRRVSRESKQYSFCLILLAVLLSTPVGMITENVWSCTTFYFYWWAVFPVAGWNWHQAE